MASKKKVPGRNGNSFRDQTPSCHTNTHCGCGREAADKAAVASTNVWQVGEHERDLTKICFVFKLSLTSKNKYIIKNFSGSPCLIFFFFIKITYETCYDNISTPDRPRRSRMRLQWCNTSIRLNNERMFAGGVKVSHDNKIFSFKWDIEVWEKSNVKHTVVVFF